MSNTGTTGGFGIGSIKDSLDEIQRQGEIILHNARGIEEMLEHSIELILDPDHLSEIKTSILEILTELRAQPELINLDSLEQIVEGAMEKIEEALGGVPLPSFDIDINDALLEFKKMLPDELPGVDLSELKPRVESIVDQLTDSGIDFRVLKDNPALAVERGKPDPTQTGKPPLKDRGKSSPPAAASESPFDLALKDFFSQPKLTELLDPLPGRIEQAIADSGIMLELEEQLLEFQRTLTNTKPLSLELVVAEIAKVVKVLGGMAIDLINGILDIILDSVKDIYEQVKTLGDELSGQIKDTLALLKLEGIDKIGPFTLPAVLLAIPATLHTKKKIDFPDFSGILQEAYNVETWAGVYGGVQFADGLASTLLGIWDYNLDDDNKYKFVNGLLGRQFALLFGGGAQLASVPDKWNFLDEQKRKDATYDLPTKIWEFQLGMLGWFLLRTALYAFIEGTRPQDSKLRKNWAIIEPLVDIVLEIIHFVLFSIQVDRERNDNEEIGSIDKRLSAASIIDPLPGIIGSIVSFVSFLTDSYQNPKGKNQIEAIKSAIENIKVKVAAEEQRLATQRNWLQEGGSLRGAFTSAKLVLQVEGGAIVSIFNNANGLLIQNGEGSLENELKNVKTQLNGHSQTIEENLHKVGENLDLMEDRIQARLGKFKEIAEEISRLEKPADLSEESKAITAGLKSFEEAHKHLLLVQANLGRIIETLASPNSAKNILAPRQNTTIVALIVEDINAFQENLKRRMESFKGLLIAKLGAASDVVDQTERTMDSLMEPVLNTQSTNDDSIGKCLSDIRDELGLFSDDLTAMSNDENPKAIENKIEGVESRNTDFQQKLKDIREFIQYQADPKLKELQRLAEVVAGALTKDGDSDFASTYRILLKFMDPDEPGHGIRGIREKFTERFTSAYKGLEAFTKTLKDDISSEMHKVHKDLDAALESLEKSERVDIKSLIQKIQEAKKSDSVRNRIHEAKKAAEEIKDLINGIALEQMLSAGGSVGSILQNATKDLAFENNQQTLKQPLEHVKKMVLALQEIDGQLKANGGVAQNAIEEKIKAIEKGLQNLRELGSKQTRKKRRRSIGLFSIVPTFLLKVAYAGLNWDKSNNPPPEIEDFELDTSVKDDIKLTANLKQRDKALKGEGITWYKNEGNEEMPNWSVIEKTVGHDIGLTFDQLRYPIRAKLHYAHGYTSKDYAMPNPIPSDITLSSNTIEENANTATAVPIGILDVKPKGNLTYRTEHLSLNGNDDDNLFEIVEVENKLTLWLKAKQNQDLSFALGYENKPAYKVTIKATHPEYPNLAIDQDFTIYVINLALSSNTIQEAPVVGGLDRPIGILKVNDDRPDISYPLENFIPLPEDSKFKIANHLENKLALQLKAGEALDFEEQSSYDVTINIKDPIDADKNHSQAFTIFVIKIELSSNIVSEVPVADSSDKPIGVFIMVKDGRPGITYSLEHVELDLIYQDLFKINKTEDINKFELLLKGGQALVREDDDNGDSSFEFTISVIDPITPSKRYNQDFIITIEEAQA